MIRWLTRGLVSLALAFACAPAQAQYQQCPPNQIFAGPPSGAVDAAPTCRPMVQSDVPGALSDIPLTVYQFGVLCDGIHDDSGRLNAAFAIAAGKGVAIHIPGAPICKASSTVILPHNLSLIQDAPASSPPVGGIVCDLAVTPCVKTDQSNQAAIYIKGVGISRAAGTIPTGSIGLELGNTNQAVLEDVSVYRNAINYQIDFNGNGIYTTLTRIHSCAASDAHIVINGEPGVYGLQDRLGCDGAFDVPSNDFIRVTGNWDATAGTVHFTDTQLNQGLNTAGCAIDFKNFTGSTNTFLDFLFQGGHIETAQQLLCSDSSVKGLSIIVLSQLWSNGGWGGPNVLFGLNSLTALNDIAFIGDTFNGWTSASITPSAQFNDVRFTGTTLLMPLSVTGISNSTFNMTGGDCLGVTVAGSFSAAKIQCISHGGSYGNTATGSVELDIPGSGEVSLTNCSSGFALQFGGASTGIVNAGGTPVCQWQLHGNVVTVAFTIQLTNVGSATGGAAIVGLPFTVEGGAGIGGAPVFNSGMSGVGGGIIAQGGASSKTLYLFTQGATGLAQLTNANFTSSSVIQGNISYLVSTSP